MRLAGWQAEVFGVLVGKGGGGVVLMVAVGRVPGGLGRGGSSCRVGTKVVDVGHEGSAGRPLLQSARVGGVAARGSAGVGWCIGGGQRRNGAAPRRP